MSFPEGFLWGAATAAYQIEGGVREDDRGESIWDRFSRAPGKVRNGANGDVACDHYHRWRGDIALMGELNLNAYRFSIAWPRILPEGHGRVNGRGLDFYDRLVEGLLTAGITPWATLYHWDLPQVLEDRGGWPNRATAEAFVDYVEAITGRLGDRVKHWITLNEPFCSAFLGYHRGTHAPGHTDFAAALQASHTLLLAHGQAVPIIRRNSPGANVGIALNLRPTYPVTDQAADREAAGRFDGFLNRWFLDPLYERGYPDDMVSLFGAAAPSVAPGDFAAIGVPIDFLGINYYSPAFIRDAPHQQPLWVRHVNPPGERTAVGRIVHPEGLTDLLRRVHHEYPVQSLYVTENGAAYPDPVPENGRVADPERTRYLAEHIAAAERAVAAGVPLRGFFVWTLLDNFEWAKGYSVRFGMIYVDFATQIRIVKDSGHWYGSIAKANRLVSAGLSPPTSP